MMRIFFVTGGLDRRGRRGGTEGSGGFDIIVQGW